MASSSTRRKLTLIVLGTLALAPASASAATLTVDDDLLDCPSAGFTSVQAGVDAASPGDTVAICPGVYEEGPATVPAGGANAVNIQKMITLKGAGASKVTIKPKASLTSLLGTTTNYRNGTGAVIGVNRNGVRTIVDVSGVTVDGGTTAVGAGVKFWDSEGSFSGGVIQNTGGPTAAQGYGAVIASNLTGDRLAVRLSGTKVTGYGKAGVVLDSTQLAPAAGLLVATVQNNTITGAGTQATNLPQQGILASGLVSGSATGNVITANRYDDGNPATTTDDRVSAGVRLVDIDLTPTVVGGTTTKLAVTANTITGNGFGMLNVTGADADQTTAFTATGNYWGSAAGPSLTLPRTAGDPVNGTSPGLTAGSTTAVNYATFRTTAATAPVVPSAVPDTVPTGALDSPTLSGLVVPGKPYTLLGIAGDDFGVQSVQFSAGATDLGTDATAPYAAPTAWTPGPELEGTDVVLTALVTDSSGQTATVTKTVTVKTPPVVVDPPAGPEVGPIPDVTVIADPPASSPPPTPDPGPVTPKGVATKVKASSKGRLTLTGLVTVPKGTVCSSGAKVTFAVGYAGGKKILSKTVKVSSKCVYSTTLTLPAKARGKKVVIRTTFLGTKTLKSRSAKKLTVVVKK